MATILRYSGFALRTLLTLFAFAAAVFTTSIAYGQRAASVEENGQSTESAGDPIPILVLGARPEWAISLRQVKFGGDPRSSANDWPFFFNPRFEVSGGAISDQGFVLGTLVVGPAFYTKSLAGEDPGPQFFQVIFDLGGKWGWVFAGEKMDILAGPRITFDLGFRGGGHAPYGTFGASVGFMPKSRLGRPRFVLMVEPGIVVYGNIGIFALAITAGLAL